MYEDRNVKIIFNTFLKEQDPLVDFEVLDQLKGTSQIANTYL